MTGNLLENTWLRLVSEQRFWFGLPIWAPLAGSSIGNVLIILGPKMKLRAFLVTVMLGYHRSTTKIQLLLVELLWHISHKEGGVKDQAAAFCSVPIHPPYQLAHTESLET